jgi:Tol biopolymer transport system component
MIKRLFIFLGFLVLALLLASCSTAAAPTSTASSKTPPATLGNASISSITLAAKSDGATFHTPLDSTPDVEATTIYFTATGSHGPGIFRVPAGGGAVTEVFSGAPFVAPRALAFSPDGTRLVITDTAADRTGELFTLAINGGTPLPIKGSQGSAPENLNVYKQNGQQLVYFTGKDPQSRQPAVLTLPITGASAPTVVVKGAPLLAPDGIVVAPSGVIYLTDRGTRDQGKVFEIEGSTVTTVVNQTHMGNPAGIGLSPDASLLLVSAHQPNSSFDEVLLVNLNTRQTGAVTTIVGQNSYAGGLHVSPGHKVVFSWADTQGTVYRVRFP